MYSHKSQVGVILHKFYFPGNRKALVEKSGLVKHATNIKQRDQPKPTAAEPRGSTNRWRPFNIFSFSFLVKTVTKKRYFVNS